MSHASPAFAFSEAEEPLALAAARALAARLGADEPISRPALNAVMADCFGGSDAEGRWSVRDANAALELAQVLFVAEAAELTCAMSPDLADRVFTRLEALVPTQTNRSDEQIEWQQFATPPRLAWLAARACAISAGELVLEPSAGMGMLGVWAAKAGGPLALNEISPLRRECLSLLFPDAAVTGCDGELIDELLAPDVGPSVVLMNPPYSHGIERGHDGRTGARHLRSAWKRLLPGGRLVAVMPEWFDLPRFVAGIAGPVALRLNAAIERGFVKQGTSITTRLLVLDKADGGDSPIIAKPVNFAELCFLLDMLPTRAERTAEPIIAARPALPLRLAASARKPVPLAVRPVVAAPSILPLVYQPLDAPAPIAEQVGHYLPYRPSRIAIEGAHPHPTPLVESVAMGSITAPVPEAVPQLPSDLIAKGILSAAQAETLIYAASAHARDLSGRFEPEDKGCTLKASAEGKAYRMGYFLGDGTGAGKGRQVASVILDRWVRGERRHIWISKNEALLEDARRDWTALGGLPIDVQPLGQWKLGGAVGMREGILFVTYPTLRSGRSDATRLEQILEWAGDDFDGVIVFDEAHAMANAAGGEGSRGKVKGSEQGIAGVRLQNLLPRARVLYASATGASDVNNLAYATRLGLWGPETAFANRETFVADIRDGGIAAMELVARDLKSLGLYTARALSFAGVEYEILEHCLTADQIAVYDAYAQGWAIIHANLRDALEETRIIDADSGDTLNSGAKAAALSVFEGTKQRFFAQLLLSMKLPSLLPAIDSALAEGNAVVVQLVSTAEAMLDRRLADLSDAEREAREEIEAQLAALKAENQAMRVDGQAAIDAISAENADLKTRLASQSTSAPPSVPPPAYGPQAGGYDARGRTAPSTLGGAPAGASEAAMPGPGEVKLMSFTSDKAGANGPRYARPETPPVVIEDSPDYLPPNSYASARVIVGVDASAGVASQTDPLPVVLRITGPARSVMQNGKVLTTRIQGCIVNGAARGDLSSEKVYVKLARMTCDQPGGRVAVSEVKGFISFAGKSGVRGRVVSREGSLVSQALLAGIVGGFGRGFSANANSVFSGVTTNADGTRSKLSAGDILGGGLGQGAADAADTVSKYLIERAEQYQPVVEMPTGIDVEIVFLDGVYVRNSQ